MAKKSKKVGRPPISDEDSKVVCFRMSISLYKKLEKKAEADRRGLSDILRIILEDSLKGK